MRQEELTAHRDVVEIEGRADTFAGMVAHECALFPCLDSDRLVVGHVGEEGGGRLPLVEDTKDGCWINHGTIFGT